MDITDLSIEKQIALREEYLQRTHMERTYRYSVKSPLPTQSRLLVDFIGHHDLKAFAHFMHIGHQRLMALLSGRANLDIAEIKFLIANGCPLGEHMDALAEECAALKGTTRKESQTRTRAAREAGYERQLLESKTRFAQYMNVPVERVRMDIQRRLYVVPEGTPPEVTPTASPRRSPFPVETPSAEAPSLSTLV